MAATMNSKINIATTVSLLETLDMGSRSSSLAANFVASLGNGTGVGLADRVFQDSRNLGPSATENLDLNAGGLLDPFGAAFTIVRVKALYIAAVPPVGTTTPNVNDVIVGAAAATPWSALLGATGTVTLRPGAAFLAVAGVADATDYVVGAGATDLLKVLNGGAGTSVNYDIMIIGSSA